MHCETYHCDMAEQACAIRRRNALQKARFKAGYGDHGCMTCEMGKAVAAKLSDADLQEYSAGIKACLVFQPSANSKLPEANMTDQSTETLTVEPKRRGRPKGSKNSRPDTPTTGWERQVIALLTIEMNHHRERAAAFEEAIKVLAGNQKG